MNQSKIDTFVTSLKTYYKGILQELKLEYCESSNGKLYIYLATIKIYKRKRILGYGKLILKNITNFADINKINIELFASDIYGCDLNRLLNFYLSQGFTIIDEEENKLAYKHKKHIHETLRQDTLQDSHFKYRQ